MFSKADFWIGLAVGVVAGAFGYKYMSDRAQQMPMIANGPAPEAPVPVEELMRQKEELEDMIAAQEAAAAKA